jgi:hypothetical protein
MSVLSDATLSPASRADAATVLAVVPQVVPDGAVEDRGYVGGT